MLLVAAFGAAPSPATVLTFCPAGGLVPGAETAAAQDPGRGALIIDFGNERIERHCVAVGDEPLDAVSILARAEVDVRVEDFGGGQLTVCRIRSVGCDYPDEPCFCACEDPGADCRFWALYVFDRDAGAWTFSQTGAADVAVTGGMIIAWRWGEHGDAGSPPDAAVADRPCPERAPTPPPGVVPSEPSPLSGLIVGGALAASLAVLAVVRWRRPPAEPDDGDAA